MSVETEEKQTTQTAQSGHKSDELPKLVRLTHKARETSELLRARMEDHEAPVPQAGQVKAPQSHPHPQVHHRSPSTASARPPTGRPDISRDDNVPGATGWPVKQLALGLLMAGVAGAIYLALPEGKVSTAQVGTTIDTAIGDATSASSDAQSGTSSASEAGEQALDELSPRPIQNRVGRAELYRQREEALAEAKREEQARLAAEREARRQAEQASLDAERARKARAERLAIEEQAERRRREAEARAARQAEQARLAAQAETVRKAEQARQAKQAEAARQAEQLRLDAQAEAARTAAQADAARLREQQQAATASAGEPATAASASTGQGAVATTQTDKSTAELQAADAGGKEPSADARFSTDPCQGPTARFLSTCP